jgi:type III restriction enzyme
MRYKRCALVTSEPAVISSCEWYEPVMSVLRLKFDATLSYQRDAILGVVALFAGLPLANAQFSLTSQAASQLGLTELGVSNPVPDDDTLFDAQTLINLRGVQERHGITRSEALAGRNFSVEMETGTGKTYVYLRTIFELNKTYGFKKFVIVVPSIAIREGVLASIDLLRDHLTGMYLEPFDASVYDSKQLGRVRQFATANTVQILVMNIQAFQKDVEEAGDPTKANIINRAQDRMSGRRPIEFIQACRPVVILDEPQNMESPPAVAAIDRLDPLCTLRYSATHKNLYNLVYRLGPIDAYDLNLVKRIEVASVVADDNLNAAFVRLLQVDVQRIRAQVQINHGVGLAAKQKRVWVTRGDDLAVASGGRQEYANGYIVDDISFRSGAEAIEFTNGADVSLGEAAGSFDEDVRRAQVFETVRQHLDKERALHAHGVKVLSLFFIDKVANYRGADADGNAVLGEIGVWFEEAYTDLAAQPRYASLGLPPVGQVHDGYFSVDNKGVYKDTRGTGEADTSTYDLIMRDKERLLSTDAPLRFIFSHSALREGWDNPNVFQICTLNNSKSADRKRQEIGRGLRLPVNQAGERIHDPQINRLTVIANEAYEQFARTLQDEYEEDTGQRFGIVPKIAFAQLALPGEPGEPTRVAVGQEVSSDLWEHLVAGGYLDSAGSVQPKFNPADENFQLTVPSSLEALRAEITDTMSKYVFANRVINAKKRQKVRFSKQVTLDPEFKKLWDRISQRTKYRVSLSSDELVTAAANAIADAAPIGPALVRVRTVEIEHTAAGLGTDKIVDQRDYATQRPTFLPDILADLQNETDLTRATLVRTLIASGRLADFTVNPQQFIALATTKINAAMHEQMIEGISYEAIAGLHWEMRRLEPSLEEEVERYAARLYKVQNEQKTPFDHVEIDSEVERRFAKALDDNRRVQFFVKLPAWFTVDTPLGPYNPDWAIVFERTQRLYLVRETKGSLDADQRRHEENVKIECAKRHFKAIDVDFAVVRDIDDMFGSVL